MIPIKVNQPLSERYLPVSKKTVHYRPFTVKEEKILLIAAESADQKSLATAFKQVITNCISETLDIGELPLFDLEMLFLLIRAAAVNNVVTFSIRDQLTGDIHKIEIDILEELEKIVSSINPPEKNFLLTEDVGVVMKDLTFNAFVKTLDIQGTETETAMLTLAGMIDSIYQGDELYKTEDFSVDEVNEFIDSMPTSAMQQLNSYLENLPRLQIKAEYTSSNGEMKTFVMEGLSDFFQYV